ncbi:D-amino-acid transaminase [Magnetovibrio sp. PR-2]|uniref:D-amino-acid transaminase n=1 Tax=Magnetovibrio sp. PR-2 TaxID=3120356 RepID=UPI002FCDF8D3
MSICYVNGRYAPHHEATVHIEDRGFQFADSVYEVFAVQNGRIIDEDGHLSRLNRSLTELGIAQPMADGSMKVVLRRVLAVNRIKTGALYLQVSRGVAPRDFPAPEGLRPTLVITAWRTKPFDAAAVKPAKVITQPDIRWKRCDIKTVQLLAGVLAKTEATAQGAVEAWLLDENGFVTEGSASNAWIVTEQGELITRHTDCAILGGVTRKAVLKLAKQHGLTYTERAFSLDEAKAAREAFTSSSTVMIRPVVQIDDAQVGDGEIGPFSRKVIDLYGAYLQGNL